MNRTVCKPFLAGALEVQYKIGDQILFEISGQIETALLWFGGV